VRYDWGENSTCAGIGTYRLTQVQAHQHKQWLILLRSDLHKLFDLGYITLTTDYHVEVSNRIKEEYENGRTTMHFKESRSLACRMSLYTAHPENTLTGTTIMFICRRGVL
jgi:hypothetical protein